MFFDFLQVFLPIVINILLIVVLIIVILIGYKVLIFMNDINDILDNVNKKLNSLNGIFNVIDLATDKVNDAVTVLVEKISNGITKVFKRKSKNKVKEEYYE